MANIVPPFQPMVLDTTGTVLASGYYWRPLTIFWDGVFTPGTTALLSDAAGNLIAEFQASGPHVYRPDAKHFYNGLVVTTLAAGTKLIVEYA